MLREAFEASLGGWESEFHGVSVDGGFLVSWRVISDRKKKSSWTYFEEVSKL